MEWHEDLIEDQDEEAAFVLVHEGLAALPARQQKTQNRKAHVQAHVTRDLQLAAFPELFKGEPEEQRLARAAAAAECWDALSQQIQDTLDATDAAVFQDLLRFVQHSHQPPAPRQAGQPQHAGKQRLPTGLVLAGGVNNADHCRTFPNLAAFLRGNGCYVARLDPHNFGKAPGDAFGEVLRQVSGLSDSRAEHLDALHQWYEEETGAGRQAQSAAASSAAAAMAAEEAEEEEASAVPDGKQEGRSLRQRPPPAAKAATAAQLANRQRPLVVLVEGTETVDQLCLRDVILTASETYQDVPLILLLGLTTNADVLHGLLSSEIRDDCMHIQNFMLASAMTRMDSLVEQVLLGGNGRWPGLLFSLGVVERLTDTFLNHYYSTCSITQGLKVVALSHFQSQPLSFLAKAAMEGPEAVEEACAVLDPATMSQARRLLGGRNAAPLAEAVCDAMAAWGRWAVGVHWLLAVARQLGLKRQCFHPWKLVEEALRQNFASEQLKEMLGDIAPLLRKLPHAGVRQLAAALQQRAAVVFGGAEAAAEQLEQLEAFAVEAEAGPEEVEGGEQQHQQGGDVAAAGLVPDGQQTAAAAAASPPVEQGDSKPTKKKAKKDRFYTKESRKTALLQRPAKIAAAKAGTSAAAAVAAAQRSVNEANMPGSRFAAWLGTALPALLSVVPTKLPGAIVFTCRDVSALDCLTWEPRPALHMALTEPHHFLPGLPEDLGFSAAQEDACLAYTLFDQDPKCINLADWYQAFAEVYNVAAQQQEQASGKKRKAAVKKAKKGAAKGGGSADEAVEAEREGREKRQRREVVARFAQATAELQYVGLIKPARRRRGDYVQRLVHMPALDLS